MNLLNGLKTFDFFQEDNEILVILLLLFLGILDPDDEKFFIMIVGLILLGVIDD